MDTTGKKFKSSVLREIVFQYQINIPSHLTEDDILPLFIKLNTAMIQTRSAVALGSGNKIKDKEKTNGWSTALLNQKRDNEKIFQPYPLNLNHDPLKTIFNQSPYYSKLKDIVIESIIINKERVENCGGIADYIANYLWKNPGKNIFRIEVVSGGEFDHVWVMINRKKGSSLLDPSGWGDAWIVDLWWGDLGRIYHASEFRKNILEVQKYLIEQKKGFNRDVRDYEKTYYRYKYCNELIKLNSKQDIWLNTTPYPMHPKYFKTIEDHYDYSTREMSLNQIKQMSY